MGSANSRSRDCSVRCLNNLSNVGPSSKHSLPFLLQAAALSRTDVIHSMKMLRDERTGGLVTLLRCIRHTGQRRLRADSDMCCAMHILTLRADCNHSLQAHNELTQNSKAAIEPQEI